mmetsp:Transcript_11900/g.23336  ORF Transcript_11900/g.23336 Transcript_11900/m.23336 type:complete len:88 (+) Transcript_11900:267-530(+)|eukprot:CAMPEP_0171493070 /NCGR_PEP_ID=MMETSP0958-20121227/4763_1 /TAXON_ID=87120 /ORGANISM="Aurantiochytrium limacinum, Strain ATCCMYA-1381" /LENGTH=87 /DNA_ID=CAMNT_0012026663 /DNA_START=233 /DNA_END=496 /DNA_ORIENTATION=-
MRIPRQGFNWAVMIVGGVGFIQYVLKPDYTQEEGSLEEHLKSRYKHQVMEGAAKNKHLREALLKYKDDESFDLISPKAGDLDKRSTN